MADYGRRAQYPRDPMSTTPPYLATVQRLISRYGYAPCWCLSIAEIEAALAAGYRRALYGGMAVVALP